MSIHCIKKVTAFFVFAMLPAIAFAVTYREVKDLELSSAGIREIRVHCGAGRLLLKGVEGMDVIRVTAELESESTEKDQGPASIEKSTRLSLVKARERALLRCDVAAQSSAGADTRVHLSVEMPVNMNVHIIDGSGTVFVSNVVGNVVIDDDSGAIRVENIVGPLRVKDTSGDLEIDDVRGAVEIVDGSGEIVVLDVTGDVNIKDASGGIEINNVGGSVTVSDGSGGIDIVKVAGNVFIREAGSGSIDVEGVKGKTTILD
jgi:hypothetical protein